MAQLGVLPAPTQGHCSRGGWRDHRLGRRRERNGSGRRRDEGGVGLGVGSSMPTTAAAGTGEASGWGGGEAGTEVTTRAAGPTVTTGSAIAAMPGGTGLAGDASATLGDSAGVAATTGVTLASAGRRLPSVASHRETNGGASRIATSQTSVPRRLGPPVDRGHRLRDIRRLLASARATERVRARDRLHRDRR
jgi:hypothetical protein